MFGITMMELAEKQQKVDDERPMMNDWKQKMGNRGSHHALLLFRRSSQDQRREFSSSNLSYAPYSFLILSKRMAMVDQ